MAKLVYDSGNLALRQAFSIITLEFTAYPGSDSIWKLIRREERKRTNDKKDDVYRALVREARK